MMTYDSENFIQHISYTITAVVQKKGLVVPVPAPAPRPSPPPPPTLAGHACPTPWPPWAAQAGALEHVTKNLLSRWAWPTFQVRRTGIGSPPVAGR